MAVNWQCAFSVISDVKEYKCKTLNTKPYSFQRESPRVKAGGLKFYIAQIQHLPTAEIVSKFSK